VDEKIIFFYGIYKVVFGYYYEIKKHGNNGDKKYKLSLK